MFAFKKRHGATWVGVVMAVSLVAAACAQAQVPPTATNLPVSTNLPATTRGAGGTSVIEATAAAIRSQEIRSAE